MKALVRKDPWNIERRALVGDDYELSQTERREGARLEKYEPVAPSKPGWIQTASGRQFWPMSPRSQDVDLDDIAHALAMKCRYSGHTQKFYSVAEHSVHIACALLRDGHGPHVALWGLVHDRPEAYLPDVARPIKPYLPGFKEIEEAVARETLVALTVAAPHWECLCGEPAIVKVYDTRILQDEKPVLMPHTPADWGLSGAPLGVSIQCWGPTEAKVQFLRSWEVLKGLTYAQG
jgi:hypothetical protein